MGHKLTGQMSAIKIRFGGIQNGTPDWDESAVTVLGRRSMRTNRTARTADVSALEDDEEMVQVTRTAGGVELELLMPETGPQFEEKVGHYIEAEILPKSSMTTGTIYRGTMTAHSGDYPDGASLERITITAGANGAA